MNISLLPIDSALIRIRHAEECFGTLQNQVKSWMNQNPYSLVEKTNTDLTRYSIVLRVENEPPLPKWSLIASDIVHSLRSALDHYVYAIARYESGQEIPPGDSSLMFPICDTSEKFREQDRRRLKTLSQPTRTALESVQPYNRPHEIFFPLLGVLRDFDDINKHRLLMIAFSAVAQGQIGFLGPSDNIDKGCQFVANSGELKDGSEIAAFAFDSPAPNMKFDRKNFSIILAFCSPTLHPVSPFDQRVDFTLFLKLLLNEVKEVIDIITKAVYLAFSP
jgi:hypothetical protein